MKKLLILAACAAFAGPAWAQQVTVLVNGTPVQFDQPPVMQGGRVLVPMRGVFQQLGASVVYVPETKAVRATHGQTVVDLTIGSTAASINGQPHQLDTPAQEMGGRTVVPLRFLSESLGAEVHWDPSRATVSITSGAGLPPAETYRPNPPKRPLPPPHHEHHHFDLRVVHPAEREGVSGNFNFDAYTEPGAHVELNMDTFMPGPPPGQGGPPPRHFHATGVADSRGHVVIPLHVEGPPGSHVRIDSFATDANGHRTGNHHIDAVRF